MTNYRSTNEEKEQRINEAADELAKGKRAMDVSKKLAKKYSVSIQQAREYVRSAKPVLTESISPNDRAYIFSKVMSCLEQDRLDAEAERDYKKVMGDYYKSGGSSGNKPATSYQGKLYTASGDPFMVNVPDGKGGFNKVHAPAKLSYEEALALAPKYYGAQWDIMEEPQRREAVLALMKDFDTNVSAITSTAAGESNDTVKEGLVINTVQFLKGLFS